MVMIVSPAVLTALMIRKYKLIARILMSLFLTAGSRQKGS